MRGPLRRHLRRTAMLNPRSFLLLAACVACFVCLCGPRPAPACLRPAADERAVQWSTAIVTAKLLEVGERTPMGDVQTPQAPPVAGGPAAGGLVPKRRALPDLIHHYSQRAYTFEVTERLDGNLKPGERIKVVRIFDLVENPMIVCSQHLKGAAVGQSFVLMLRPLSEFPDLGRRLPEAFQKEVGKEPFYAVVHLEPAEALKGEAMQDLRSAIGSARAAEAGLKDRDVSEEIEKVVTAADDVKAEPAVRELARMGPKVLPAVRSAEAKATGDAKVRLGRLVEELTPPDPVTARNQGPVARQGQEDD